MEKIEIELIVEKGDSGLWGRVNYNDNLIIETGVNVYELETKIKDILHELEDVDPKTIVFNTVYDIYSLFKDFDFLNISKIAVYSGIHSGLLRQYASGVKHPSANQAKKIEDTLHRLADLMKKASIYVS
ncbi:hypothetical protein [Mucilaginibacter sp. SJ]|uniref:hypothetical protein n=1 Tax=Mucilaginibacter sp. SJ TaxID=3029053 RepID=UPI0023A946E6|nr:hypothetical protein [Mucilaginibacter sp. SJ]WEA00327.1 hypothetical protein MusilaSJ_22985 [Mucilaginibacter sp. SJ]